MFLVSTRGTGAPIRVGDMRMGATYEDAIKAGESIDSRGTIRMYKLYRDRRPVLVAERTTYRGEGWQLTKRGSKLIHGE